MIVISNLELPKPFRTAKKECYLSSHHQTCVGACIVRGGRIISRGHNVTKWHKIMRGMKKQFSIHAEVSAILSNHHKIDFTGTTIYVYRSVNGRPALAKPCYECIEIMKLYGIKKAKFTTGFSPYYGEIKL